LVAGGVLGAATYYLPFDVVILNGEVIGPKHPEYELDLLLLLPVGAAGYVAGRYTRRERGTVKTA
jgi:hypothetical protein